MESVKATEVLPHYQKLHIATRHVYRHVKRTFVGDEIPLSIKPTKPPIGVTAQRLSEGSGQVIVDWAPDMRAESLIEFPHEGPTRIEFEKKRVDVSDETIFQVAADRKGPTASSLRENVFRSVSPGRIVERSTLIVKSPANAMNNVESRGYVQRKFAKFGPKRLGAASINRVLGGRPDR